VVTAILDIVHWYCGLCGVCCGDSNSRYSAMALCCVWSLLWLQQTDDIVQWYCVGCGVYCGYCNSRFSAMVLCCVWKLLWLKQQ